MAGAVKCHGGVERRGGVSHSELESRFRQAIQPDMKILVLGATGGTGQLIVSDAVAKGIPSWRWFAQRQAPICRDKVGQMSKISWRQVLALALAAFFVVGSLSNIFAPPSIYEEYLRWGYPRWFHFVTGSLELTTAVLLARAQTRLWGSALGAP